VRPHGDHLDLWVGSKAEDHQVRLTTNALLRLSPGLVLMTDVLHPQLVKQPGVCDGRHVATRARP
jgi:hypothetical protein